MDRIELMTLVVKALKESLSQRLEEMKEEKDMTESKEDPISTVIEIRKAENGFIVSVEYPKSMLGNPVVDSAQDIFSAFSEVQQTQDPGNIDPAKAFTKIFDKLKHPKKALRKPYEEYIFQSMESMFAFIKETLESEPKSDASGQPE